MQYSASVAVKFGSNRWTTTKLINYQDFNAKRPLILQCVLFLENTRSTLMRSKMCRFKIQYADKQNKSTMKDGARNGNKG